MSPFSISGFFFSQSSQHYQFSFKETTFSFANLFYFSRFYLFLFSIFFLLLQIWSEFVILFLVPWAVKLHIWGFFLFWLRCLLLNALLLELFLLHLLIFSCILQVCFHLSQNIFEISFLIVSLIHWLVRIMLLKYHTLTHFLRIPCYLCLVSLCPRKDICYSLRLKFIESWCEYACVWVCLCVRVCESRCECVFTFLLSRSGPFKFMVFLLQPLEG